MATQANQIAYGTQSPASAGDTNYWQTGDIVYNNNAAFGSGASSTLLAGENPTGWICTSGGYPGTWAAITPEPTQTLTTTATSGTLTQGYRMTFLNPASTGTYSLPDAAQNMAGAVVSFKNLASGSTTLTPLSSNGYADAAAITLAQYASVSMMTAGGTTWYKVA